MKRPVYVQYVFIHVFRKPSTAGISFSLLLFAFCCLQVTTLHSVPYLSAYAAQLNSQRNMDFVPEDAPLQMSVTLTPLHQKGKR
jgi:hypothetical protein